MTSEMKIRKKTKIEQLEITLAKYIRKVHDQNEEIRRLNKTITGHKQTKQMLDAYLTYSFSKLAVPVPEGVDFAPDGSDRRDSDKYLDIRLDDINKLLGCEMCVLHSEDKDKRMVRIYIREPEEKKEV